MAFSNGIIASFPSPFALNNTLELDGTESTDTVNVPYMSSASNRGTRAYI